MLLLNSECLQEGCRAGLKSNAEHLACLLVESVSKRICKGPQAHLVCSGCSLLVSIFECVQDEACRQLVNFVALVEHEVPDFRPHIDVASNEEAHMGCRVAIKNKYRCFAVRLTNRC